MEETRSYVCTVLVLGALVGSAIAVGVLVVPAARAAPPVPSSTFASEQVCSPTADDWEPYVAADSSSTWVYQAVTYINASKTCSACPGTAVFFRASSDSGTTWGAAHPIYLAGGKGWQYDPQIKVATDGTVYVVFLQTFDPGSVLFKSTDRGQTWSGLFTMNGALTYNDKPILVISPSGRDVYVALNVKRASYVAVSHDYGTTFTQVQSSTQSLWWYSYGGAIAPAGTVYFAQVGESGGKVTNGGHTDGPDLVSLVRSTDGGATWQVVYRAQAGSPTPCGWSACYQDFLAAQSAVAADASGTVAFAYTFNAVDAAPEALFVTTSSDGVRWSTPGVVNNRGDSNMPAIVAGPTVGDFRLAWMDDRNAACWNCGGIGGWNTWFVRTTNGGKSWSANVRLSNQGSGAPYKSPSGFTVPLGDYFGLAADAAGTNYPIWGEGDGSSIYCCGGSWYTKGP